MLIGLQSESNTNMCVHLTYSNTPQGWQSIFTSYLPFLDFSP